MEFNIDAGGFGGEGLSNDELKKLLDAKLAEIEEKSREIRKKNYAAGAALETFLPPSTMSPAAQQPSSTTSAGPSSSGSSPLQAFGVSDAEIEGLLPQDQAQDLVQKIAEVAQGKDTLDSVTGEDLLNYYTQSDEANLLGRAVRYWAYRQSPILGGAVSLASRMIPKDPRDPSMHPMVRFIAEKLGGPEFVKQFAQRDQLQPESASDLVQGLSSSVAVGTPTTAITSSAFTQPGDVNPALESFTESQAFTAYDPSPQEDYSGLVNQTNLASEAVDKLTQTFVSMTDAAGEGEDKLLDFTDTLAENLVKESTGSANTTDHEKNIIDATLVGSDGEEGSDGGFLDTALNAVGLGGNAEMLKSIGSKVLPAVAPLAAFYALDKTKDLGTQAVASGYDRVAGFMSTPADSSSPISLARGAVRDVDEAITNVPLLGSLYDNTLGPGVDILQSQLSVLESIDKHAAKIAEQSVAFNPELMGITIDHRMRMLNYRIERAENLTPEQIELESARNAYELEVLRLQDAFYREAAPFIAYAYEVGAVILEGLRTLITGMNFIRDFLWSLLTNSMPGGSWLAQILKYLGQLVKNTRKQSSKYKNDINEFLDPMSKVNADTSAYQRARRTK